VGRKYLDPALMGQVRLHARQVCMPPKLGTLSHCERFLHNQVMESAQFKANAISYKRQRFLFQFGLSPPMRQSLKLSI